MTWTEIALLLLGLITGWLLRFFTVQDQLVRHVTNEKFVEETQELDALLNTTDAHTDLSILMRLDAGVVSEAKTILIYKLGLFYHRWNSNPKANEIPAVRDALLKIKKEAKQSESLQAILTHRPKDKSSAV